MILCSKSHAQAPSPLVILSGAKDLGFSPVSNEKRSEMFRFAQHDKDSAWNFRAESPGDTSKRDKRNVVSV
jgi:hypothetical protein